MLELPSSLCLLILPYQLTILVQTLAQSERQKMTISLSKIFVVLAVAYGIWNQVRKPRNKRQELDEVYEYIVGE